MDKKALSAYKEDPDKARDMLTEYCKKLAEQVVKEWWEFAWRLVAKYDDGYINEPQKMAQEVGYPESWYENSKWVDGPTTYKKQAEESK